MKSISHKQQPIKNSINTLTQYSYNDIVDYLDLHWSEKFKDVTLATFKKIDAFFGNLTHALPTVVITGSNGKGLTSHFTTRLLKEEGLTIGALFSPHILTYNEQIAINGDIISNKSFTDIGNEVLNSAQTLSVTLHSRDMLTLMALLFFKLQKVDVTLLETTDMYGVDPVMLCKPKIIAITRITDFDQTSKGYMLLEKALHHILHGITPQTYIISADQSKINLQIMHKVTKEHNAQWAMPIRKLAPLPYPFEQLHGRSAALAERIASIYANSFLSLETTSITKSILIKQKGQRGRPTLEAKRQAELNPRRTTDQFWKDAVNTLPGRFQVLDKEKPTILLDNASNLDALQNLLLGVRLLHYHRPYKGLTLILGIDNEQMNVMQLLKLLRYFFKKTSGNIIICPTETMSNHKESVTYIENVSNAIKSMKIKAKPAHNFKEAFELAQKSVDERYGLIIITGTSSLLTEYWRYKGMKKL